MALITLTFSNPLNASCQVGDTAYYVNTQTDGGFTTSSGNIVEIGQIREIDNTDPNAPIVKCHTTANGDLNGTSKFILFSKDNKANMGSLMGYYSEVKMSNNSTAESKLFSVGTEIALSSK